MVQVFAARTVEKCDLAETKQSLFIVSGTPRTLRGPICQRNQVRRPSGADLSTQSSASSILPRCALVLGGSEGLSRRHLEVVKRLQSDAQDHASVLRLLCLVESKSALWCIADVIACHSSALSGTVGAARKHIADLLGHLDENGEISRLHTAGPSGKEPFTCFGGASL